MAATIYDVAKEALVSPATVSRYLALKPVSEDKKQRLAAAIKRLDYKVNLIARGLKYNKSMTIGVIVRNINDIFEASILIEAEKILKDHKYSLMACSEENYKNIGSSFQFLIDKGVDGIIYFSNKIKDYEEINNCINNNIPVVLIDEDIKNAKTDKVFVNNSKAIYEAVIKLYHLNHRDIAIINGPKDNNVSLCRYEGYKKAFKELGLKLNTNYIEFTDYSVKQGYEAGIKLLTKKRLPTALCVTNYFTFIGVMKAIRELRLKIPDDLSLIVMDKYDMTEIASSKLTAIKQPIQEMGKAAAQLLLKRIDGDYSDFPQEVIFDTIFFEGDTICEIGREELWHLQLKM